MSDTVKCVTCDATARRPRMHLAPEGWLYGEMVDEEDGTEHLEWACSEACAKAFWKPGPGPRFTVEEVMKA